MNFNSDKITPVMRMALNETYREWQSAERAYRKNPQANYDRVSLAKMEYDQARVDAHLYAKSNGERWP